MGSKEETGEGDDEIYVVGELPSQSIERLTVGEPADPLLASTEEILDYDLVQVDNKKGEEGYDAKLPAKRWEVRYLVK